MDKNGEWNKEEGTCTTLSRANLRPIHNHEDRSSNSCPASGGRLIVKSWRLSGPPLRYPESRDLRALYRDGSIAERITDLYEYERGKRIIATRCPFCVILRGFSSAAQS